MREIVKLMMDVSIVTFISTFQSKRDIEPRVKLLGEFFYALLSVAKKQNTKIFVLKRTCVSLRTSQVSIAHIKSLKAKKSTSKKHK